MKLTHKQRKIWTVVSAIATLALLASSILPYVFQ